MYPCPSSLFPRVRGRVRMGECVRCARYLLHVSWEVDYRAFACTGRWNGSSSDSTGVRLGKRQPGQKLEREWPVGRARPRANQVSRKLTWHVETSRRAAPASHPSARGLDPVEIRSRSMSEVSEALHSRTIDDHALRAASSRMPRGQERTAGACRRRYSSSTF